MTWAITHRGGARLEVLPGGIARFSTDGGCTKRPDRARGGDTGPNRPRSPPSLAEDWLANGRSRPSAAACDRSSGANRNDIRLLEPTGAVAAARAKEPCTLDQAAMHGELACARHPVDIQRRGTKRKDPNGRTPLGLRWIVECATNGELRTTAPQPDRRSAQARRASPPPRSPHAPATPARPHVTYRG